MALTPRDNDEPLEKDMDVDELPNLKIGSFEIIPPSEKIKYPYVLYVPENDRHRITDIMMWGAGSLDSTDRDKQAERIIARGTYMYIKEYCEVNRVACITPVLPRTNWNGLHLDAQMLTRATMIYDDDSPAYFQRPDIEIRKMLMQVKASLGTHGYNTAQKFIVGGGSAGGALANRFSVLYPNLVKGAAVLLAGDAYPEPTINGQRVGYPFGTADIEQITGNRFNLETFRKIKYLVYAGGKDTDPANNSLGHDLNGDEELIDRLRPVLGSNQVEMATRYVKRLEQLGMDVTFIYREDLGHATDKEVMKQLGQFLDEVREK